MADCTVNVSAFAVVSTQLPRAMTYLSPGSFVTTVNAVTFGAGAVDATVNLSAFAAATTSKAVTPAVDIAPAVTALTATQNAVTVLAGTEVALTTLSYLSTMQAVSVTTDCTLDIASLSAASTMQSAVASGDCNVTLEALASTATMQAPTVEIPTVANVTGWAVWSTPLSVTVSTSGNATVDLGALSLIAQMSAVTVTAEQTSWPASDDSSLRYSAIRPTSRGLTTDRRVVNSAVSVVDRAGRPKARAVGGNALRHSGILAARAQGSRVGTVSRRNRAQ